MSSICNFFKYSNNIFLSLSFYGFLDLYLLFSLVIVPLILITSSIDAQEVIVEKHCSANPLDSSRNVLEISGDFPNSFFNVTAEFSLLESNNNITNCHIFIHDLHCSGILISSSISNNTNITITNVFSTNKTRPTFILFNSSISDFGFININNVAHDSLSIINEVNQTENITAVTFNGRIAGGSTNNNSIFNISSVRMSNVTCDRTASPTCVCSTYAILFQSSVRDVFEINASNISVSNIVVNSSGFATATSSSYVAAIRFRGTLVVHRVFFDRFSISDVVARNSGGWSLLGRIQFGDVRASSSFSSAISSFSCTNIMLVNVSVRSRESSDTTLVKISNFGGFHSVLISNLSFTNITTESDNRGAVTYVVSGNGEVSGPPSSSPLASTSSFVVSNIFASNIYSYSKTDIQVYPVALNSKMSGFNMMRFSNITLSNVNSTSRTSAAYINVVSFFDSIQAFSSPSLLGNTNSNNSSIVFEQFSILNASSVGVTLGVIMLIVLNGAITNFSSFRCSSNSMINVFVSGRSTALVMNYLSSEIRAPVSSGISSSFIVENFRAINWTSVASASADLRICRMNGAITNYAIVSHSSMEFSNISSKGASTSYMFVVHFASTVIAAPQQITTTSPLQTSFVVHDISVSNATNVASFFPQFYVLNCVGAVMNYSSLKISNIRIRDISITALSYILTSRFLSVSSVTGPTQSASRFTSLSPRTSFVVDGIEVSNIRCVAPTYDGSLCLAGAADAISNFDLVQFSNFSVSNVSLSSTGSSFSVICSTVTTTSFSSSSSSSSAFLIGNLKSANVSTRSTGTSSNDQLSVVKINGAVTNFTTIKISNVSATLFSSNAGSWSSNADLELIIFMRAVTAPNVSTLSFPPKYSFVVENMALSDVIVNAESYGVVTIFSVVESLSNFNFVRLANISCEGLTTAVDVSFVHVILFRKTIVAGTKVPLFASSLFEVEDIAARDIGGVSQLLSVFRLLGVMQDVTNFNTIRLRNFSVKRASISCSGFSIDFFLIDFGSSVSTSSSSNNNNSKSLILVENVEMLQYFVGSSSTVEINAIYFEGEVHNYSSVTFNNVTVENGDSFSEESILRVVSLGNFESPILPSLSFSNIVARNLIVSASTTAEINLVSILNSKISKFLPNCFSHVAMENSELSRISIASSLRSEISLFTSPTFYAAETMLVRNCTLNLERDFSSSSLSSISPQGNLAVFFVRFKLIPKINNDLVIASSTVQIENNTFSISDAFWQNSSCNPRNCSLVRIDNITSSGNEFVFPSTNGIININNNDISSLEKNEPKLSFISFGSYGSSPSLPIDTDNVIPLIKFSMQNNSMNITQQNEIISFDSYGASAHQTFKLPPPSLVHVEIGCNHWKEEAGMSLSHRLALAASPMEVNDFFSWTCLSHTRSETATRPATNTRIKHSISPLLSPSPSPALTTTSSASHSNPSSSISTNPTSSSTQSNSAPTPSNTPDYTTSFSLAPAITKSDSRNSRSISSVKSASASASESISSLVFPPHFGLSNTVFSSTSVASLAATAVAATFAASPTTAMSMSRSLMALQLMGCPPRKEIVDPPSRENPHGRVLKLRWIDVDPGFSFSLLVGVSAGDGTGVYYRAGVISFLVLMIIAIGMGIAAAAAGVNTGPILFKTAQEEKNENVDENGDHSNFLQRSNNATTSSSSSPKAKKKNVNSTKRQTNIETQNEPFLPAGSRVPQFVAFAMLPFLGQCFSSIGTLLSTFSLLDVILCCVLIFTIVFILFGIGFRKIYSGLQEKYLKSLKRKSNSNSSNGKMIIPYYLVSSDVAIRKKAEQKVGMKNRKSQKSSLLAKFAAKILRSEIGRFCFVGSFLWMRDPLDILLMNERRKRVRGRINAMRGAEPSLLLTMPILFAKQFGPVLSQAEKNENNNRRNEKENSARSSERLSLATLISNSKVINNTSLASSSAEVEVKKSLRSKISPYFVFMSILLTANAGFLQGYSLGRDNERSLCHIAQYVNLAVSVTLALIAISIRPHIVPLHNLLDIVLECTVAGISIAATVMVPDFGDIAKEPLDNSELSEKMKIVQIVGLIVGGIVGVAFILLRFCRMFLFGFCGCAVVSTKSFLHGKISENDELGKNKKNHQDPETIVISGMEENDDADEEGAEENEEEQSEQHRVDDDELDEETQENREQSEYEEEHEEYEEEVDEQEMNNILEQVPKFDPELERRLLY